MKERNEVNHGEARLSGIFFWMIRLCVRVLALVETRVISD